jgi:hypothetical protein
MHPGESYLRLFHIIGSGSGGVPRDGPDAARKSERPIFQSGHESRLVIPALLTGTSAA